MTKTLAQFLSEKYWGTVTCTRIPKKKAQDFRWFITDDYANVRSHYTREGVYYAVGLNNSRKQVIEIDCDGYAFYVTYINPKSEMGYCAKCRGWEEIPENLYDVEVKDL